MNFLIKRNLIVFFFLFAFSAHAQKNVSAIDRIEPPNWWVGMKWNKVQVLVHSTDPNFGKQTVTINYPGVSLAKVNVLSNPKYLALDLVIDASAQPGNVVITIGKNKINWPIAKRRDGNGTKFAQGLTSADLVYLLMPDRFSNGDPSNDRIAGMRDQTLNRDSIYYRHGGDLPGVINHLDYLQSMGVTALWMTPIIENDMPERTEHGYAFTNHYKVEPRFGGEAAYKKLSDELHKRGMKLIQDAVYNHVGLYHVEVQDKPVTDWLHEWPTYTQTNYKDESVMDPYAAKIDQKINLDGWFTPMMPDINQSSPLVSNFLIQHALWSVEEFGLDAWRIDTYKYCDLDFMNVCNKALLDEYPNMYMFGETWVQTPLQEALFVENNLNITWKSNLPGGTDFQTNYHGIFPALYDHGDGFNSLYQTLSSDFLYKDPSKMVSFLDNHDTNRALTQVGDDVSKYKLALSWLLTTRGIPQLYYGEEILMKGKTWPRDGYVRLDFPGGWVGDKKNAFTQQGLTAEEKDAQDFVKKLANYRKNSSAITSGKLMQFAPQNNMYVYFRYDSKQTILVILNANKKEMKLSTDRFAEIIQGKTKAKNVMTGESAQSIKEISVQPTTATILELE